MADGTAKDSEITYAQFKALANSMPNLAWMAHPDGWIFWYNQRWYDYTGTTPEEMAGWGWQSVHDPAVLPSVLERFTKAIQSGEPFEMTFPLRRADGVFRPFLTRTEPLRELGVIVGWFGSNTDITEQERTRERLELMVNELNHRVKNTLATIHSIAANTFRDMKPESLQAFEKRLQSLSAVHDVLTRETWSPVSVKEVAMLATFVYGGDQVTLNGHDDVLVEPRTASALAMTLHELCTNAVKYGALSVAGGRVALDWETSAAARSKMLTIRWTETGGPTVIPPAQGGFGLRMIERALAGERGARVEHRFEPGGVVCVISTPVSADVLR